MRNRTRRIFMTYLICFWMFILMGAAFISPGAAEDDWVLELSKDAGYNGRSTGAIAIFGDYVYVAANRIDESSPEIFRYPIHGDHLASWWDKSPPWETELPGNVMGMEVVSERAYFTFSVFSEEPATGIEFHVTRALYVVTSGGELWRLDAGDEWAPVPHAIWEDHQVFSMAAFPRLLGPLFSSWLCVQTKFSPLPPYRRQKVYCLDLGVSEPGWRDITWEEERSDFYESGDMHAFDGCLYVGLGEGSADPAPDQKCIVTKYCPDEDPRWSTVTRDCFGSDTSSWVTSMEVYDGWLYIGTGGHPVHPQHNVIYRTDGSALEDVTPESLFSYGMFGVAPLRFGSMAAANGLLYVGITNSNDPLGWPRGQVLVTNGAAWEFSSEPGFGVPGNNAVTGLAGSGTVLYAVAHNDSTNPDFGFQVYKRIPPLPERLGSLFEHSRRLSSRISEVGMCLARPVPCPELLGDLLVPMDDMMREMGEDGGGDGRRIDGGGLLEVTRMELARASWGLGRAIELARQSEQSQDAGQAGQLWQESKDLVIESVHLAKDAIGTLLVGTSIFEPMPARTDQVQAPVLPRR